MKYIFTVVFSISDENALFSIVKKVFKKKQSHKCLSKIIEILQKEKLSSVVL